MITNYYSKETVDKLVEAGFYEWSDSQFKTYANEKRYTPDADVLEDWLRDEKHIYISISPASDKPLGEKFNAAIYTKNNDGMPIEYFKIVVCQQIDIPIGEKACFKNIFCFCSTFKITYKRKLTCFFIFQRKIAYPSAVMRMFAVLI